MARIKVSATHHVASCLRLPDGSFGRESQLGEEVQGTLCHAILVVVLSAPAHQTPSAVLTLVARKMSLLSPLRTQDISRAVGLYAAFQR